MKTINIINNIDYLKEYFTLCAQEWGKPRTNVELEEYANNKVDLLLDNKNDKLISVIGLINNNTLIGFISLFNYDGEERTDLTPWYATMYIKKEYRNRGYSKILNAAMLNEAKKLGYSKVYLKSNLVNYYEKFGAKYIEDLKCKEKLYYINL